MGFQHVFQYLFVLSLVLLARTQQNTDKLEDLVNTVFSTNPQQPVNNAQRPRQQSGGFGTVVQPEPNDPTRSQPDFTSISGKAMCNCVPYHMCDPSTNTINGEFDEFAIDIRFNNDDPVCPDLLDICCDNNRTRTDTLIPRPVEERPNRPKGCGVRNVGGIDFNITGAKDNEAGFGEFPWTVALLNSNDRSYFCAGSLIHPSVVLTGTHCLRNRQPSSFLIRAGEWDTQTTKERLPYEERTVRLVISHPQFNDRSLAYDFSLVILSEPITLADHINVICLPGQNAAPSTGSACFATGWGQDVFGAAGRYSAVMKRVPLPIADFGNCQTKFRGTRLGPRFTLDRSFICAGGEKGVDTCKGDGGAPLVCPIGINTENRYQQSGIVAWGIGCNDNLPAAYANVALVRSWIDEQMVANGFGTTSYSAF